ncbi:hypothetical protein S7335_218 [Synechococcus sp. PCC 7335]|nr:hypothetical protein S7335_218 [Synechococcus sp. PCC 7335]
MSYIPVYGKVVADYEHIFNFVVTRIMLLARPKLARVDL